VTPIVTRTMCMPTSVTTLGSIFYFSVSQALHRISYIAK